MTDYKVNRDKGYFGTDNPATPVREAMPFVVQTDGKNKLVNIGIVSGAHGSHVAGIAAGQQPLRRRDERRRLRERRSSRSAPASSSPAAPRAALTDGMIYVAKQANVDVINMSIGGLPSLNDGNNARALLYTRLIEQEQRPDVHLGRQQRLGREHGRRPGGRGQGDERRLVHLEGRAGRATTAPTRTGSTTCTASARAARARTAASSRRSSLPAPRSRPCRLWQAGQPVAGTYTLPPGYGMFNGTSMASPQAAGAAALLISAAKQAGVQQQPDQIREALKSSARAISIRGSGAYEQGVGIIDVPAAWNLLKTNLKTDDDHVVRAGQHRAVRLPRHPGRRPGIYDREGVTSGRATRGTYTFTRTSGGGGAVTYNLSWLGNDGTFSSAARRSRWRRTRRRRSIVTVNPTSSRDPLGGPRPRRSQQARDRVRDLERRDRRRPVHRRQQLLGDEVRHDRPEPDAELLLQRPGGHAGVQGRLLRSGRDARHGAGALPALPPVRRRDRLEREHATATARPAAVVPPAARTAARPRTRRRASGR